MKKEELWVMITCLCCVVSYGAFYAFIIKTVPKKEEIDFRTRLHLHMLHSKQGNIAEIWYLYRMLFAQKRSLILCLCRVAIFSFGSCALFVYDTYLEATPLW